MFLHRRRPARWSTLAGSYSTNAFSIRLPPDTPVIDPASLRLAGDDPENLSVLVHEYWHYLQNLTTVAGFVSFVLQQDFVATFSETLAVNGDGTSVGSDAIGGDLPDRVRQLTAMLDARDGEFKVETIDEDEVSTFRITGVDEDDYPLTWKGRPVPLRKVTLDIEAEMADGSTETGTLIFGQTCVEEGVAYLIDRMVAAGGAGAAGPDNAPPFPYWVLRELALTGSPLNLSSVEIASLGTFALLTPDPAGDLVDHQQLRLHQRVELPVQSIGVHGAGQPAGQVHGRGEVHAVSQLGRADAQANAQVRLAHARRTQQHDAASFLEEPPGGQLVDQPAVDRRLRGEVKVLQAFQVRELGELQVQILEFGKSGKRPTWKKPGKRTGGKVGKKPKYIQMSAEVARLRDKKKRSWHAINRWLRQHGKGRVSISTVRRAYDYAHRTEIHSAVSKGKNPNRSRWSPLGEAK